MLRIKLGPRTYVGDTQANHPFLPRQHAGWDPTMSDQEVYNAARGWWRLNSRAEQERYALVLAGDQVRLAIAVKEWRAEGDRRAFAGEILAPGDPVYDKFVGQSDPAESTSRFPVLYLPDPLDAGVCRCGCGQAVTRGEWAQGHDQRAIHERIRSDFGGSVSRFIDWYDANGPFASSD
ncbi:hypothetical protein [Micromonospora chersina]|uniref:hypothetical protein n=1 Tax=Micromonospora chersina TaxID=47854 RepID=UPI003D906EE4